MDDIRFLCPSCGKKLVIDSGGAGMKLNCPSCSAEVIVPSPQAIQPGSKKWFVSDGAQQKGPFAEATISEMVSNGMLNEKTMLWSEGMASWIPLSKSPFAQETVPQGPPPLPQQQSDEVVFNDNAPSPNLKPQIIKKTPAYSDRSRTLIPIQSGHLFR